MTITLEEEVICGVCRKKSEHAGIMTTSTFGFPDLDARPAEMERSTIHAWVQRCPTCGYCASTIADASPTARSIVDDPDYRLQLKSPDYPELANSFLCKAIIEKESGTLAQAVLSTIHAVWACDDSGDRDSAKRCRKNAVELIKETASNGEKITDQEGADVAITVDLLRRSEEFKEAEQLIDSKLDEIHEGTIREILKFEKELISRSDVLPHTIDEVMGEG